MRVAVLVVLACVALSARAGVIYDYVHTPDPTYSYVPMLPTPPLSCRRRRGVAECPNDPLHHGLFFSLP
jgi:hypothetical protein